MSITSTDFFCGMGGSSTGLRRAGFDIKVAANHWARAIETHSANHPDTEHLLGDLQAVDVRYLPRTDLLWASPICTELSPAGGRRRKGSQLDLFEDHGHVPSAAFERTRVTFWEVIRAAEVHRYPIVLIENVVEAAAWELFDVWLAGMEALGYEHQFVSVSAAHVGAEWNPPAPTGSPDITPPCTASPSHAPDHTVPDTSKGHTMTDRIDPADWIAKRRELLDAATEGPWYWRNTQEVYLFGARSRVVMAFERMGMQGAQPVFRDANNLLFPVGKANLHDIPDARLIADARTSLPRALDALEAVLAPHQLHEVPGGQRWCLHCGADWPCPTVAAITEALS